MSDDPRQPGKPRIDLPGARLAALRPKFNPARESGRVAIVAMGLAGLAGLAFIVRLAMLSQNSARFGAADLLFEFGTFGLAGLLLALVAFVAFVGWQYAARKNLAALGNSGSWLTPGASILAWLPGPIFGGVIMFLHRGLGRSYNTNGSTWTEPWIAALALAFLLSLILPFPVLRHIANGSDPKRIAPANEQASALRTLFNWWCCQAMGDFLYLFALFTGRGQILMFPAAAVAVLQTVYICKFVVQVNAMQARRYALLREMQAEDETPFPT